MENKMKLIQTIAVAAILATQTALSGARAGNENPNIDVTALLKRLEELEQKVKVLEGKGNSAVAPELEQKVKILERKGELAEEAAAPAQEAVLALARARAVERRVAAPADLGTCLNSAWRAYWSSEEASALAPLAAASPTVSAAVLTVLAAAVGKSS